MSKYISLRYYVIGGFAQAISPVLIIYILIDNLGLHSYGSIAFEFYKGAVLSTLISLGQNTVLFNSAIRQKNNLIKPLINAFMLVFLAFLALLIISPAIDILTPWSIIIGFSISSTSLLFSVCNGLDRAKLHCLLLTVWSFGNVILTMALLSIFLLREEGRYVASATAALAVLIIGGVVLQGTDKKQSTSDKASAATQLSKGLILVPYSFSNTVLIFQDKLALETKYGAEVLGYYAVAFQGYLLVMLCFEILSRWYSPILLRWLRDCRENRRAFRKLIIYLPLLPILVYPIVSSIQKWFGLLMIEFSTLTIESWIYFTPLASLALINASNSLLNMISVYKESSLGITATNIILAGVYFLTMQVLTIDPVQAVWGFVIICYLKLGFGIWSARSNLTEK